MKTYVLTFLFKKDFNVWLIEKQKPEWQKGCLNGIGGKVEDGENPLEAAIRELKEESGVEVSEEELIYLGDMNGTNNDGSIFTVHIFTGFTDKELKTQEEEQIVLMPMNLVRFQKRIENVPMLLAACHYRLTGTSQFNTLTMNYNR